MDEWACGEKRGTRAGYQRHWVRGEKACDPCQEAERANSRLRYAEGRDHKQPCSGSCGGLVALGQGSAAEPMCRSCRAELVEQTRLAAMVPCAACGSLFLPVRKSNGKLTETCSFRCGMDRRKAETLLENDGRNNRRRYLKREREAPGFATSAQVKARWAYYGGRCWMCGGPATTTDHVKPLAAGGSRWPSNLRPACRSCNGRKRDCWPWPIAV